jgi:hypothetical protein
MNDNDLERQLRAQAGPREEGYMPTRLPMSPDEAPMRRPSPVLRAAVLVPAVAAGVLVVAVAAMAIRGVGSGSNVGSGGLSTPSASGAQPSSPAVVACRSQDFAWSTDPWTGAAGSRGTNVLMRGVTSLDGCTIDGSITVEIRDANGEVLSSGSSANHQHLGAGDVFEVGIAWSNWCNSNPSGPLSAVLRLPGDAADVPLISSGGDISIPPCNGPGQPTNLSVTDLQRSNRPFPEG